MPGGGSLNPATAETVAAKMHYVHQAGGAVFKIAVRKMAELSEAVLQRNDLTAGELDLLYPAPGEQTDHPGDGGAAGAAGRKDRDQYRSSSAIRRAATIPLAMETALQQGRLKKGATGAAGGVRGRVYGGRDVAAVGVLALRRAPAALIVKGRTGAA